jgi:subtilisin family serine protease
VEALSEEKVIKTRETVEIPLQSFVVFETGSNCGDKYLSEDYINLIVQYSGNIIEGFSRIDYACAFVLNNIYAVVAVRKGMETQLFQDVQELIFTELSAGYFLTALSPINTANISIFHENPYITLRGNGVIVGMLDTGIDYLNVDFMTEDDRTRIISIWDQTVLTGPPPKNFSFGTEFTREQINEAIAASLRGEDPYDIVNHRDEIGHGTGDAAIVGARGRGDVIGGAPDCEFVMVKLKPAKVSSLERLGIFDAEGAGPIYESADLALGMSYLIEIQRELNRPLVILIPLGSNFGGHDGSTAIERYIDYVSLRRGVVVVTGTGNQGTVEGHGSGVLNRSGEVSIVEINVGVNQRALTVFLWASKPDKISVGLVAPSGESVERIPIRRNESQEFKFIFEQSTVNVDYFYPENITGDTFVKILIRDIKPGVWQLRIIGEFIVNGRYDLWLSSSNLLRQDTRLLNPDPLVTLQIPATSRSVLVTGTYNQDLNILYPPSGRGYTRDGRVKPDVTSGGFEVLTAAVGGGTTLDSGSSMAASVLTSAVALILQWGIVDGNDPNLYAHKIRTYLIRGTRKRPGDIYPNPEWGYGILDLEGTFNAIRNLQLNIPSLRDNENSALEVFSSNVKTKIPPEIIDRLL